MNRSTLFAFFAAAAVSAFFTGGCRVDLNEKKAYSCVTRDDCGGEGFLCAAPAGGAGRCCQPLNNGIEQCNGLDDDCNGKVDDGFPSEICNGIDDDCNGKVDEGFDTQNDSLNCGSCGIVCTGDALCDKGTCRIRAELNCVDQLDNDSDQTIDCGDFDCNLQLCGPGCQCRALKKAEGNCTNGNDDDGDGKADCADEDCGGAGCGDGGCNCVGGFKAETNCTDGEDNDQDSQNDCGDSDCNAKLCQMAPSTFRCGAGSCRCNDGGVVAEMGAALCRNRVDDDCDGLLDCQEAGCNNLSCALDGGAGCVCLGGTATETSCNDRQDNDDDGNTDCGEGLPDGGGDCGFGVACTFLNGSGVVTAGTCKTDRTCGP